MWNEPTPEQLARIPRLYETENIPLKDKPIHLHCFIGGCDWFISEYDGEDLFFGYVILNNDVYLAEWGYASLAELKSLNIPPGFDIDCEIYDPPRAASEIKKILIK
jgi:hypothetical protein